MAPLSFSSQWNEHDITHMKIKGFIKVKYNAIKEIFQVEVGKRKQQAGLVEQPQVSTGSDTFVRSVRQQNDVTHPAN